MAIVDGWVDWAERRFAPADKVYSEPNASSGLALHSAEGSLAGSEARMLSRQRDRDGRYTSYAAASWMFFVTLDGRLIQYYPVTASTWTTGNRLANTTLWSVEAEGTAFSPLNGAQVTSVVRLVREWERHTGDIATREQPGRTLWEHREAWNWSEPNAGPTACPSERYAPFYAAWQQESVAALRRELADLQRIVVANGLDVVAREETLDLLPPGTAPGETVRLVGDAALGYAVARGFSFALGLGQVQQRLAEVER